MIKIYPTSRFKKSYKRLPLEIKRKAEQKVEIFVSNPFHPVLKTHKLKGKLKDYWSFSVDKNYRILFKFVEKDKVIFFDIGTHEIYK